MHAFHIIAIYFTTFIGQIVRLGNIYIEITKVLSIVFIINTWAQHNQETTQQFKPNRLHLRLKLKLS